MRDDSMVERDFPGRLGVVALLSLSTSLAPAFLSSPHFRDHSYVLPYVLIVLCFSPWVYWLLCAFRLTKVSRLASGTGGMLLLAGLVFLAVSIVAEALLACALYHGYTYLSVAFNNQTEWIGLTLLCIPVCIGGVGCAAIAFDLGRWEQSALHLPLEGVLIWFGLTLPLLGCMLSAALLPLSQQILFSQWYWWQALGYLLAFRALAIMSKRIQSKSKAQQPPPT